MILLSSTFIYLFSLTTPLYIEMTNYQIYLNIQIYSIKIFIIEY